MVSILAWTIPCSYLEASDKECAWLEASSHSQVFSSSMNACLPAPLAISRLTITTATSALDARSELKVMSAIRAAVESGITVIMIAHRLSTVLTADHIIVLQDGRAVEQGPPAELSKEGTVFSGLLAATQNTSVEAQPQSPEISDTKAERSEKHAAFQPDIEDPQAIQKLEKCSKVSLVNVFRCFLRLTHSTHGIIGLGVLCSIISGALIIGEAIVSQDNESNIFDGGGFVRHSTQPHSRLQPRFVHRLDGLTYHPQTTQSMLSKTPHSYPLARSQKFFGCLLTFTCVLLGFWTPGTIGQYWRRQSRISTTSQFLLPYVLHAGLHSTGVTCWKRHSLRYCVDTLNCKSPSRAATKRAPA